MSVSTSLRTLIGKLLRTINFEELQVKNYDSEYVSYIQLGVLLRLHAPLKRGKSALNCKMLVNFKMLFFGVSV